MNDYAELLIDANRNHVYLIMDGKEYPELNEDDLVPERGFVLDTDGDISTMEGVNGLLVGIKYSSVKEFKAVERVFSAIPTGNNK
ncbi:hypothetical protein [Acinetobacter baumannii]|uniref:hypothetical protein n=1 Tax=Acinetobacter baumannii TaxID=470 RepID=UPI001AAF9A75|nr:hypothetical protein [Acinetobacter baumannii]MBO2842434.1 hypothetical protein [Acinetobacter baumannii]